MSNTLQPVLARLVLGVTCLAGSLPATADFELVIEDNTSTQAQGDELLILEDAPVGEGGYGPGDNGQPASASSPVSATTSSTPFTDGLRLSLDRARFEYGHFESDSPAQYQLYGHARGELNWQQGKWELQAGARVDGYRENPDEDSALDDKGDWDDLKLDYDDTFVRYRGEQGILTVGAQKIIWGRVDEIPPTDRLSTQDLRRGMQDDLEDRRLASLAIRYEHFFGSDKLDAFYLPRLRAAELPDRDSVWYPINQHEGTIFGIETTPLIESVVRNVAIDDEEPDTDGGFGLRFNHLGDGFDYAFAVQHGVGNLPYFTYNMDRNRVEVKYLRSTTVSADVGMEALGGTVKLEAAWNSDTPITRTDGRFDVTESLAWGVALELFPGDGDARLNLQLMGNYLLNAPDVLDRDETVTVNGSLEWPFGDNDWRARLRFNVGLDMSDLYFNPELTYTGFNNHEIYLELHQYDGDTGSVGGFYEDNSSINLGWRITL